MLRLARFSVFKIKTKQSLWAYKSKVYCTVLHSDLTNNSELETQVLRLINENDVKQLKKYIVPKVCAKQLILYREQNGPYKSLQDLLLVDGIDFQIIEKLCAVIHDNLKKSKSQLQKYPIIPKVSKTIQKTKDTIVGIHIGPMMISWVLLNRSYEVLQWDCYKFTTYPNAASIYDSTILVLKIVDQLPASDLYILEERSTPRKQSNLDMMYLQEQNLAVALMGCLAIKSHAQISSTDNNNLFILRRHTSARFFKLLLGTEVISSKYVISKLLNDNVQDDTASTNLPTIRINDELKGMYQKKTSVEKEQMNWSLLKAVTFVTLGIHAGH